MGAGGAFEARDRHRGLRLVVSDAAVGKHIANILAKLDLPPAEDDHRRVLAVLAYLRR